MSYFKFHLVSVHGFEGDVCSAVNKWSCFFHVNYLIGAVRVNCLSIARRWALTALTLADFSWAFYHIYLMYFINYVQIKKLFCWKEKVIQMPLCRNCQNFIGIRDMEGGG